MQSNRDASLPPPPPRMLPESSRRRQKKKKKKNVPSLTPLEEASKRLDEIFTIKNNVTGISAKSRIVPSRNRNQRR